MAWYPVDKEMILIGSNQPINIDFQGIEERFAKLSNYIKIMSDIDFGTATFFFRKYLVFEERIKIFRVQVNSVIADNNPSLEYLP